MKIINNLKKFLTAGLFTFAAVALMFTGAAGASAGSNHGQNNNGHSHNHGHHHKGHNHHNGHHHNGHHHHGHHHHGHNHHEHEHHEEDHNGEVRLFSIGVTSNSAVLTFRDERFRNEEVTAIVSVKESSTGYLVEKGFTTRLDGNGIGSVTVRDLMPRTNYEFKVRVNDSENSPDRGATTR